MKNKHISLRMEDKLFKLIAQKAKKEHTTISDSIIDILQIYFNNNEDFTILEKNYLVTCLTYQYMTLGENEFIEKRDDIIEEIKNSIHSSNSIR